MRDAGQQQFQIHTLWNLREQWAGERDELRTSVRMAEIGLFAQLRGEVFRER